MAYFNTLLTDTLDNIAESRDRTDAQWLAVLKKSTVPYGKKNLGEFSDEALMDVITDLRAIIPDHHKKFAPFYLYQVARGHMAIHRLGEDRMRIWDTIDKFTKLKKKATWEGSKNLFDYKNWRELERTVNDYEDTHVRYEEDVEHSKILFTHKYIDKNHIVVAQLLGYELEETPFVQYWLRKILTAQGAYKYGRGTQWCTAVDPARFAIDEDHPFYSYNDPGLYAIEKADNNGRGVGSARRPIVQICGGQIMNKHDQGIGGFGNRLRHFVHAAAREVDTPGSGVVPTHDQMDRASKNAMLDLAQS